MWSHKVWCDNEGLGKDGDEKSWRLSPGAFQVGGGRGDSKREWERAWWKKNQEKVLSLKPSEENIWAKKEWKVESDLINWLSTIKIVNWPLKFTKWRPWQYVTKRWRFYCKEGQRNSKKAIQGYEVEALFWAGNSTVFSCAGVKYLQERETQEREKESCVFE